jgi:1-acyl-sn-glycerol-3-phosphate acyltransferase
VQKFDHIRPYNDEEVQEAIQQLTNHPMIKALLNFTFPYKEEAEVQILLDSCNSIYDFQTKVIYHSVQKVLENSCDGFTTSGFENLEKDTSYLFISNHRDIILDTSLLNVALYDKQLVMTASAIGDNLVKKPFLMSLSKLNRNFLIQRGLSLREMLQSSKLVSSYIKRLVLKEKRSVWIAQGEGRTKNGDDKTQQGVLKMLSMANDEDEFSYLKKLKIVPVAISYEYDPTDLLKIPELMAKAKKVKYIKTNNEDFNSILQGAAGNKKRIHISAGTPIDKELDVIDASDEAVNKKLQQLATLIDGKIYEAYKLWPSNYIAYDLLNSSTKYQDEYNEKEKRQFERRVERRVAPENDIALKSFLEMYANPVINKETLIDHSRSTLNRIINE